MQDEAVIRGLGNAEDDGQDPVLFEPTGRRGRWVAARASILAGITVGAGAAAAAAIELAPYTSSTVVSRGA